MKRKTGGLLMVAAGMMFLLVNAFQYLSGTLTTNSWGPIGITLVVIGAGIAKSGKKNGTPGTH